MSAIQVIIDKIHSVTGIMPNPRGGNRTQPIEYVYTRYGNYDFRLELYFNGTNQIQLDTMVDKVHEHIQDYGDTTLLSVCSIESSGGGSFTQDNIITVAKFYDVIDYTINRKVPIIPEGTITITSNGTYDVYSYANALVYVSGGGGGDLPLYDGPNPVHAKFTDQTLPTDMHYLDADLSVLKIPVKLEPDGTLTVGDEYSGPWTP